MVLSEIRVVLPGEKDSFIVEKIVQFAAVDFIERKPNLDIVALFDHLEYVLSCQQIKSSYRSTISKHSMSLSTTSLTICKTGNFSPIESTIDQWSYSSVINLKITKNLHVS